MNSLFRRKVLLLALLALTSFGAACSGTDEGRFPDVVVIEDRPVSPEIATSELVVGPNRFVLALVTKDGQLIVDAKVTLKFWDLNGKESVLKANLEAASVVPARDAGLPEVVEHQQADGSTHNQYNVGEDVGFYATTVTFDTAGDWGVEISASSTEPKMKETFKVRFNVLEQAETPPVGSPAPRSQNLTLRDVSDIREIDSAPEPRSYFHQMSIAEAIALGRPALVFFGVPGYCTSRLCGPSYGIMAKLYPQYEGKVEFIQVEFYKEPGNPDQELAETVVEWKLRNEPRFFVIDSKGIITAKFEGPISLAELDEALKQALHP